MNIENYNFTPEAEKVIHFVVDNMLAGQHTAQEIATGTGLDANEVSEICVSLALSAIVDTKAVKVAGYGEAVFGANVKTIFASRAVLKAEVERLKKPVASTEISTEDKLGIIASAIFYNGNFYPLDEVHALCQRHDVNLSLEEIEQHFVKADEVGKVTINDKEYWGYLEIFKDRIKPKESLGTQYDAEIRIIFLTQGKLMPSEMISRELELENSDTLTVIELVRQGKIAMCEHGGKRFYGLLPEGILESDV